MTGLNISVTADDGTDLAGSGEGASSDSANNSTDSGEDAAAAASQSSNTASNGNDMAAGGAETRLNESQKSAIHTGIDKFLKINSFVSAIPKDSKEKSAARAQILEKEIDKLRGDLASLQKALTEYKLHSKPAAESEASNEKNEHKKHRKHGEGNKNATDNAAASDEKKSIKPAGKNKFKKSKSRPTKHIYTIKNINTKKMYSNRYLDKIRHSKASPKQSKKQPIDYKIKSLAPLNAATAVSHASKPSYAHALKPSALSTKQKAGRVQTVKNGYFRKDCSCNGSGCGC